MNRNRLRLLSIILALILPMRAFAAANSYSFYAAAYHEVALRYGTDPDALYDHYISIELYNGYLGKPYVDV